MQQPIESSRSIESLIIGSKGGVSSWFTVTQEMISDFGAATCDSDPMHIDPNWARENTPYGGAIAFGFLTVSLLTHMLHDALGTGPSREPAKFGYFLNYGFDYLRLLSPVPAGSRIRGKFSTKDVHRDEKGRDIVKFQCEVEIEGQQKLALVAQWLAIWMPPEVGP